MSPSSTFKNTLPIIALIMMNLPISTLISPGWITNYLIHWQWESYRKIDQLSWTWHDNSCITARFHVMDKKNPYHQCPSCFMVRLVRHRDSVGPQLQYTQLEQCQLLYQCPDCLSGFPHQMHKELIPDKVSGRPLLDAEGAPNKINPLHHCICVVPSFRLHCIYQ